jgi:hypothetical protein
VRQAERLAGSNTLAYFGLFVDDEKFYDIDTWYSLLRSMTSLQFRMKRAKW